MREVVELGMAGSTSSSVRQFSNIYQN